jgi:uncharacterized protein (DUF934 family)
MKFIDRSHDAWHEVTADDSSVAVPAVAPGCLLSLPQWLAVRSAWPADTPVGLVLDNDADLEPVAADLARLAVVALRFPKWTDGRAYSQARLLRARHRFAGEVRATGEVLVDMLPLLDRTGFDAVLLRADQAVAAGERALGFFPDGHYQGDRREPMPRFARAAE